MAYSGAIYKNTYLSLLPYEIQDNIFDINHKTTIKALLSELRYNLNPSYSYAIKQLKKTIYSKKIDYILSVDWQNISYYYMEWISNIIHNGNRFRINDDLFSSTVRTSPSIQTATITTTPATCGDYELMVYEFTEYTINDTLCKIYDQYDCVELAKEIPEKAQDHFRVMLAMLTYQEIHSLVKFIKSLQ